MATNLVPYESWLNSIVQYFPTLTQKQVQIKSKSSTFVPLFYTDCDEISYQHISKLNTELGGQCYIQKIHARYKNDVNDVVPELVGSLSEEDLEPKKRRSLSKGGTTKKITKKNKARSINKRKRRTHKNKSKYSMKKYKKNTKK